MSVLRNAWKRIVKVVLMPDDVMGIKRVADDESDVHGVRDPFTSRVK